MGTDGTTGGTTATTMATTTMATSGTTTTTGGDERCQDGVAEECDGKDFGGKACTDFKDATGAFFTGGTLACDIQCRRLTGGCTRCGNGKKEAVELCDGAQVSGRTCAQENSAFTAGTLTCNATCDGYDTSKCMNCGNGTVEAGEQCDSGVGGETCASKGFTGGGTLACFPAAAGAKACQFDTRGCCGDGQIGPGEDCDCGSGACTAAQLGNETCAEQPGFHSGTLACDAASCKFDTKACSYCGDGTRNGPEKCEGTDLGGATCASEGGVTGQGTVSCAADCTIDTSACVGPMCGDTNAGMPTGNAGACPAACTAGCTTTPEGPTCKIDCKQVGVCGRPDYGGRVDCPDNFNCEIDCGADHACDRSVIKCPATNGNCDVTCNGEYACYGIDLQCSPGLGDCSLHCQGKDGCQYGAMTCSEFGTCDLVCDGTGGADPCYWNTKLKCGKNECAATCNTGGIANVVYECGAACNCHKGCDER